MTDFTPRRTKIGFEDQRWVGSAHGTDATQSITLDLDTFTKETHFPDDILKSGMPLQKLDNGHYGLHTGPGEEEDETPELAGFLYTSKYVTNPAASIPAAILEHGRVKTALLPVTVAPEVLATAAGRIIVA